MANHPNRARPHDVARGIAYEETGDEDWSKLETAYGGGGYQIDREKLAARIAAVIKSERDHATKEAHTASAPAFRDMGVALKMIRDAVEELGPVAACSVSRDQFEPRPIDDAEAIIAGILAIEECTVESAVKRQRRAERDARVMAFEQAKIAIKNTLAESAAGQDVRNRAWWAVDALCKNG